MKVLILGTESDDCLGSVTRYCKEAFAKFGHAVRVFDVCKSQYLRSRELSRIKGSIKKVLPFPHKIKLVRLLEKMRRNKSLIESVFEFEPDIVFAINGEEISVSAICKIRKRMKVKFVNWFIDPLTSRFHRKLAETVSGAYDYFFSINSPEINRRVKLSSPCVAWFPMACYPPLHREMELSREELAMYGSDVCFVGTVNAEREKILEKLLDFDLKVWCPPKHAGGRIIKPRSKLAPYYQGRGAYAEELSRVYNAAKVIVDIQVPRIKPLYATTLRPFEVGGCGGFLICDNSPVIAKLYRIGEEIVCYDNEEELHGKTRYYLEHPAERRMIAQRCHERTYSEHTYEHRISKMLELIV
jgi:spore maturation protein CgeB